MSNEIGFKIELREVGGIKRLILMHDSGQGPNEIVVNIGTEAMVVDVRDNANAGLNALRLLQGQVSANQHAAQLADLRAPGGIMFTHGATNTNGDLFEHNGDGKYMPPAPRNRAPGAVRNPNDK